MWMFECLLLVHLLFFLLIAPKRTRLRIVDSSEHEPWFLSTFEDFFDC